MEPITYSAPIAARVVRGQRVRAVEMRSVQMHATAGARLSPETLRSSPSSISPIGKAFGAQLHRRDGHARRLSMLLLLSHAHDFAIEYESHEVRIALHAFAHAPSARATLPLSAYHISFRYRSWEPDPHQNDGGRAARWTADDCIGKRRDSDSFVRCVSSSEPLWSYELPGLQHVSTLN